MKISLHPRQILSLLFSYACEMNSIVWSYITPGYIKNLIKFWKFIIVFSEILKCFFNFILKQHYCQNSDIKILKFAGFCQQYSTAVFSSIHSYGNYFTIPRMQEVSQNLSQCKDILGNWLEHRINSLSKFSHCPKR